AGRADRQACGQSGGGEGERLTRGRVGAADLQAGRGANRPGLVTGAADGDRVARRCCGAREGELVDVPAAVVLVDGQGLLARGQGDGRRDGGPGLPAAGRRDVDVPRQVGAGGAGDVQAVGDAAGRGQPQADRVGPGRGDVDGVLEPLPGLSPADVVSAAGVGAGFQVHAVGAVAVGGAVSRGDAVGYPLPA